MPFIYKPIRQYMEPNDIAVDPTGDITFSTVISGQICRAYRLQIYTLDNTLVQNPIGGTVFNKTTLTSPLYNGDVLNVVLPGTPNAHVLVAGQSYKWQEELFADTHQVAIVPSNNTMTISNVSFTTGDIVYVDATTFPEIKTVSEITTTANGTASIASDTFLNKVYPSGQVHTAGTFVFTEKRKVISSSTSVSGGTVSVTDATFLNKTTANGLFKFKYDGTNWKHNATTITLADYGITLTGTPATNDIITVTTQLAWYYNSTEVSLAEYGISLTGTGTDNDTISVTTAATYLQPFTSYYVRQLSPSSIALYNYIEGARTDSGRIWFEYDTTGSNVSISNVAISEQIVFQSYADPTVELIEKTSQDPITSQQYTFVPTYSQAQGVGVANFTASIRMQGSETILDTSGIQSTSLVQYTFDGLQTNRTYQVKFEVTNTIGQVCDTGWVNQRVSYEIPNITVAPTITNDDKNSAVVAEWGHISTTVGTVRDGQGNIVGNPNYISNYVLPGNKAIQLPANHTLTFPQVHLDKNGSPPTFWWSPSLATFTGLIMKCTNSTTGEFLDIGYDGLRFYANINGTLSYGQFEVLSTAYVYCIGIINDQVAVTRVSTSSWIPSSVSGDTLTISSLDYIENETVMLHNKSGRVSPPIVYTPLTN